MQVPASAGRQVRRVGPVEQLAPPARCQGARQKQVLRFDADICCPFSLQAVKYDEWGQSEQLAPPARYQVLAKNGWTDLVPSRIADAQRRGVACFDRAFYVNANQFDLGFIEAQPDPQVLSRPLAAATRMCFIVMLLATIAPGLTRMNACH